MSTKGKKTGKRSTVENSGNEEQMESVEARVEDNSGSENDRSPVETNWSEQNEKPERQMEKTKSVLDFDRHEASVLEKRVSDAGIELSDEDLLKMLIRRGEVKKNPTLKFECGKTLQIINGEKVPRKPFFKRDAPFFGFRFGKGDQMQGGPRDQRDHREQFNHRDQRDPRVNREEKDYFNDQKEFSENQSGQDSRNTMPRRKDDKYTRGKFNRQQKKSNYQNA